MKLTKKKQLPGVASKASIKSVTDMHVGQEGHPRGLHDKKATPKSRQAKGYPKPSDRRTESPTSRRLNDYLDNFQDAELDLLLSDFSRPGTSASSRPGTQSSRRSKDSTLGAYFAPHWSSRPGNANLPVAASPDGMPCWQNLSGWQGSKPSTADPKAVNSASTVLPSLPGSSGFDGSDVSSTGESWRRALTSRSESPWKERLARVVSPGIDGLADLMPTLALSPGAHSPVRSPSRASRSPDRRSPSRASPSPLLPQLSK